MSILKGRKKGSAIALSAALALALVLIGIAFVGFSMYFGASNEAKNAADAGALNLVKQILIDTNNSTTVALDSSKPEEQFFVDVTENADSNVTLRNINRVWAKALLVSVNADAAGSNAGNGTSNATTALQGAQEISDALAQKLTTASNLYSFFDTYSMGNTLRMLGIGLQIQHAPTGNWQTSLMDRNDESNIEVGSSLSSSFSSISYPLPSNYQMACSRNPMPQGANGLMFLPGYVPLHVGAGSQPYWLVPFQYDEKPHLISSSNFAQNQQPPNTLPESWQHPVPNAFSVEGNATKHDGTVLSAMTWVQSNPRQTFTWAIPHSYIHILLNEMDAHWYFLPDPIEDTVFNSPAAYDYTGTSSVTGSSNFPGGVCTTSVDPGSVDPLGAELIGMDLHGIIFGYPSSGSSQLENFLLNRCDEMITDLPTQSTLATGDVDSALGCTSELLAFDASGDKNLYLYSNDGKTLTCQTQDEVTSSGPQWLQQMINNNSEPDADGTEMTITDNSQAPAPIFFSPIPDPWPCFDTEIVDLGFGFSHISVYWTPGSGYNGCLGQVRVNRWTDIDTLVVFMYSCW